MGELFSWWLVVELLGMVSLPLVTTTFARLPDRGATLAKPLALLLVGWLVWFPLTVFSALPFTAGWIIGVSLLFALGNALLLRDGARRATLRALVRDAWRHLLAGEALFAGAFALMAWVRSFNPAVVDTEKFMDEAFIAAIWRAPHLPAPDPWLSGQTINYYYFGHFLIAGLAKALGAQPAAAFNIGVALIFALAALAIYGVASNLASVVARLSLARAIPFGVFSAVATLVLGNLNGAQVWWKGATALAQQQPRLLASPWAWWSHRELWTGYDWWSPSRVIPNTINEFPAFSFTLADLHAHVLALPFAALAVGVALNLLLAPARDGDGLRVFGRGLNAPLTLGTTAIALGSLYAINGWDLPTYCGLALLALAMQQWLAHGRRFSGLLALDIGSVAVILLALVFLAFLPFYRGFISPSQGIAAVAPTDHTTIGYEVAIFGLPLFIALTLLLAWLARGMGAALEANTQGDMPLFPALRAEAVGALAGSARPVAALTLVGAFGALALWTAATQRIPAWTVLWLLATLALCVALAAQRLAPTVDAVETDDVADDDDGRTRGELLLLLLVGAAAALILVCEFIYLRDIFNTRMNTVFKLYFQAWLLLGLAAGPALAVLARLAQAPLATLATLAELPASLGGRAADRATTGALATARVALAGGRRGTLTAPTRALAAVNARKATGATVPGPQTGTAGRRPGALVGLRAERERMLPVALRWLSVGGMLVWMAVLVTLLAATLVYPTLATSARTANFSLPRSLDGAAYMANDPVSVPAGCTAVGAGSNHKDNEAIAWLNTHVTGNPVIVEAAGCEWSHYSRVSAFTGLPTLLGWPGGHEGEWRVNWLARQPEQRDIFGERLTAINVIYTSNDPSVVTATMRQFSARLLYVGAAERALYPNDDLNRYSAYMRVLYTRDGVTIYELR